MSKEGGGGMKWLRRQNMDFFIQTRIVIGIITNTLYFIVQGKLIVLHTYYSYTEAINLAKIRKMAKNDPFSVLKMP